MNVICQYDDSDTENETDSFDLCAQQCCEICKKEPSKYRCPRCSTLTCSLRCCRQHKTATECSGVRNRAEFVKLSEYKESNLRNDFHLLEDISQTKDSSKRTFHQNCGGTKNRKRLKQTAAGAENTVMDVDQHSPDVRRLVKALESRGTKILIMPYGMTKRAQNSTSYRQKGDLISWKVHVVFIIGGNFEIGQLVKSDREGLSADGQLVGVAFSGISESLNMQEVLNLAFDSAPNNSVLRHTVRKVRLNRDKLLCCIQKIPSTTTNPTFYEVPLDLPLRQVLSGKTVIEYPTFVVGLPEDLTRVNFFIRTDSSTDGPLTAAQTDLIPAAMGEAKDEHIPEVSPCARQIHAINLREETCSVNRQCEVESNINSHTLEQEIERTGVNVEVLGGNDVESDSEDEEYLNALKDFVDEDLTVLRAFIQRESSQD